MAALDRELIRRNEALALLFAPPFDQTPRDPGYIKGYPPGVRENGGQYTHAAAWTVMAFAALGQGDKAAELFAMLNPMTNTLLTLLSRERMRAYYATRFWRDDTIYSLVAGRAHRTPNRHAIRDRVRRITYRQLVDAADALAADLARHGRQTRPAGRVWLPSRVETAIALLACSRNGYVCCPSLHRDHTVGEIVALVGPHARGRVDRASRLRRRRRSARHLRKLAVAIRCAALSSRAGPAPRRSGVRFADCAGAGAEAAEQTDPNQVDLSAVHVRHDRSAEGCPAQRQHPARHRPR